MAAAELAPSGSCWSCITIGGNGTPFNSGGQETWTKTRLSIMVATGRGATQGVLFRDAAAIENTRKVDTLIIDKTGTLTEGRPTFECAVPAPGFDADEVLRLAASLDQGSEHPLSETIVRAARERGMALDKPENFESGSGTEGRSNSEESTAARTHPRTHVGFNP